MLPSLGNKCCAKHVGLENRAHQLSVGPCFISFWANTSIVDKDVKMSEILLDFLGCRFDRSVVVGVKLYQREGALDARFGLRRRTQYKSPCPGQYHSLRLHK